MAQYAFRDADRESPTGQPLFCMVLTHEFGPGYIFTAEAMTDGQLNNLIYVTTQRCAVTTREEVPDRHSPNRPLYFEAAIIPFSSPESRIIIWEGTNIRSLAISDPSGAAMKPGATSF